MKHPTPRLPGITEQRLFLLLPWLLLLLVFWVGVSLLYRQGGLLHRSQLQQQIDVAGQERDELQRQTVRRQRDLEHFRTDERALEEAVRTRLGLIRDGEVLYITPESQAEQEDDARQ